MSRSRRVWLIVAIVAVLCLTAVGLFAAFLLLGDQLPAEFASELVAMCRA